MVLVTVVVTVALALPLGAGADFTASETAQVQRIRDDCQRIIDTALTLGGNQTKRANILSNARDCRATADALLASPTPTVTTPPPTSPPPTSPPPTSPPPTSPPPVDQQPSFPIRAAFTYPWFPETWGSPAGSNSHYTPSKGFYDSANLTVARAQVAEMQYGGIEAGISSWWGQGTRTDQRTETQLRAADGTAFRWSLYYEVEGTTDPSSSAIASDLNYIKVNYADDPNFLRVNGKPVIFVYAGSDGCGMADRWEQGNATAGFYVVLKLFSGYRTCANQPESWHQYGPSTAIQTHLPESSVVSPGFWHYAEGSPRLARDASRFAQNVRDQVASGARWQLITTFNEWGESTAIEPSTTWGTQYLDILHDNGVGTSPPPTTTTPPPTSSSPPPAGSFRVAAAGDICDDANCGPTSDLVIAQNPDMVVLLGDNAYNDGSLSQYMTLYDPTWGRFKAKTQPAPGNHEYGTSNQGGYRTYFGFSSTAPLYRSFNAGGWHFVQMDTTTMSAAQMTWINSDLAANNAQCEIAYGHHPRWSSGSVHGSNTNQDGAWNVLAGNNVDIVLYGHEHNYERFGLIDGMREFISGTGGANHYGFGSPIANSQVRIANTYGVLFLTLGTGTYSWQFRNNAGTVLDSGNGTCH